MAAYSLTCSEVSTYNNTVQRRKEKGMHFKLALAMTKNDRNNVSILIYGQNTHKAFDLEQAR